MRVRRWAALGAPLVFLILLITFGIAFRDNGLDQSVAGHAHRYFSRHPTLVSVAKAATLLGSTPVLIVVSAATVLALLLAGRRVVALRFALIVLGCDLAVGLVKVAVARPRPVFAHPLLTAGGYAFPSGHAANSCAVYGMVLLTVLPSLRLAWQRTLSVLLSAVVVLAILASRVLLGVHWLSDVVAGLALGVTALQLRQWTPARPLIRSRSLVR